jgi:hypothetical protein
MDGIAELRIVKRELVLFATERVAAVAEAGGPRQ